MDRQEAKAFLGKYFELAAQDLDTALVRYVTDPDLVQHARLFGQAFPGYRVEPIEMVAEGNKVAVYARFHGTHLGPFMGLEPTGKEVSAPFMIMYIIEDEKIVKHHIVLDEIGVMRQLGIVPEGAAA